MQTPLRSRNFTSVALVICLSVIFSNYSCVAQSLSCIDLDSTSTKQESSLYLRSEVLLQDGTKVISRSSDSCDYFGVRLTEYYCQNNTRNFLVKDCLFGCLSGACISPYNEATGCFTKITLGIKQSSTTAGKWIISVLSITQEIDRLWYKAARSLSQKSGDEDLKISVRNSLNGEIAVYFESITPSAFRHSTKANDAESLISEVVLPFNSKASSVLFEIYGSQMLLSLPPETKRCARPCISSPQVAGKEGDDTCCLGSIKTFINSATFVCNSMASASPSPSY